MKAFSFSEILTFLTTSLYAADFRSCFIKVDGAELYTTVCRPANGDRYPVILQRSPYVDDLENVDDATIRERTLKNESVWLKAGYAVVSQHCRGRGRSSGECIPYIFEREDGLRLQEWVRKQDFYNGEIYLIGGSYTSSVHYVTAPFAEDIKGAVLSVQDCERYNCNYRNGFYKVGLHGGWYVDMYKKKQILRKNYSTNTYNMLPLIDFSKTIFGEQAEDFDAILRHPKKDDPFWQTRYGGGEAHNAIKDANIPILLVSQFYDIYLGGAFDMWNGLSSETRAKSALVVGPYDHGQTDKRQPVKFPKGKIDEQFGSYALNWLGTIRGTEKQSRIEPGKVTYYRLFENTWKTGTFENASDAITIPLGDDDFTYIYNPYDPAGFKGGLSNNFGGTAWQDAPNSRYDIKSFESAPFERNRFFRGKMKALLCVKSDCADTCFYVRTSLVKAEGAYGLRDDITAISNVTDKYVPGTEIMLDFSFDEHAFLVKKGEKIRIDVSSSAFPQFVRHTNMKGPYCEQTEAKVAHNTIVCNKSSLTLYAEE